jgi:alkanesulfonate monooxygenase
MDPLTILTGIASRTERIKLGTNVLVLPIRQPVLLAKQIATLEFLAPGRFILGVGSGYNPKEFEATGTPMKDRGKRTDEYIEVIKRLLSEPKVSYKGEFCQFEDISIEPLPAKRPPIWVGGGSMTPREGVKPSALGRRDWGMSPRVLQRIVNSDGWIARGSATVEEIANDWTTIKNAAKQNGKNRSEITFASYGYLHLVETKDREKALRIQKPLFEELLGKTKNWKYAQKVYLTGTVEDVIEKMEGRKKMGVDLMFFFPVSLDTSQLDMWNKIIIPMFK